ncbi:MULTISPECIES: GntR family transcriptional regulator [Micrococcaceae]|jgi:DNA-binding GntR family transcriptional regulator|uniref:GntR family transcriptional regulator n=1 Tax=Micrococcaceae TaxID=1268 RepID=UPI0016159CC0|nr:MULTISPECIES: GntR family transcriptional regulator [Micrococcaceae]MBB5750206.1 DNA-binding GntR family transcriptional regulator [Micrococcus sp. TA1]HRO29839.1 GntR family transcriptional regulator [Citricoccus sp.]HRO93741.1 GntR family transcriptional regulator [Citricoccus sp.]
MAKRTDAETLSKHIRDELRTNILKGQWAPGGRLQLNQLSEQFNTSSTVVREALTRLAGDRLVVLRPNRGFFVPTLSLDELRDLTELRVVNEQFAATLAIDRGDLGWEGELMAAHHRMEKTPSRDEDNRPTAEWAAAHQAFHAQLLAACGVPVLIDLTNTLSDLQQLYNRWATSATNWSGRDLSAEHQAILDAALARDAETTCSLLAEHYRGTIEAITQLGVEVGLPAASA